MLSYVRGKIMHKSASSVMVQAGSLGYEILLPANRLAALVVGDEAEFFVFYHLREDQAALYGFQSWAEREFFLLLLNVSGVGPKGALAIVGQSSAGGIYRAIAEENLAYLTKLPGVGKKTAQRLILELKDKVPQESYAFTPQTTAETLDTPAGGSDDIMAALMALGYHESEVRRIYPELKAELAAGDEQAVIKKALRLLARI